MKTTTASSPRTQSRWLRVNLWLHRWTSLIATLPFLVLCLTGTVLIFHDEIDMALGILPPAPGLAAEEQPLAGMVEKALIANPDKKMVILGIDADEHPGLALLGMIPTEDKDFTRLARQFAHLATGELGAASHTNRETFTGFLFELHAQWFLGQPGALIGAFIALLVLIALLTGLVIYWPHARRMIFGVFRRGRGPRLRQLDLHNFIGIIVLGWALVVTLTGLFLGVGTIVTSAWAQAQLKADHHQSPVVVDVRHPPINADGVREATLLASPGWSVMSIIWPGTEFTSPQNYAVLISGSGLNKKLFRVVLVSAITGDVMRTVELPWYMKAIVLSQPLHFGDYGGLPLKLFWIISTWLTLFITLNGAWLWWSRRPQQRQPSLSKTQTQPL